MKMPQIEMIPFLNDHFVLITHPSHPLAHGGDVKLPTLAGQRLIGLDPGGPAHELIDQILRENKIDPMMKFDNIESVKKAVEIDAGIAIVPQLTVLQEVKQGCAGGDAIQGAEIHPAAGHLASQGPRIHAGDGEIHRNAGYGAVQESEELTRIESEAVEHSATISIIRLYECFVLALCINAPQICVWHVYTQE